MEQQYNPIIQGHKQRSRQSINSSSHQHLPFKHGVLMKIQLPILDRQNPKIKLNIKRQKNISHHKKKTYMQDPSSQKISKKVQNSNEKIPKNVGKQNSLQPQNKYTLQIMTQQKMQISNKRKSQKQGTMKLKEKQKSKNHLWSTNSQKGQELYDIQFKRKLQMQLLDKQIANEALKEQLNVLEQEFKKISWKKKKINLQQCSNILDIKFQPFKIDKVSVNASQDDEYQNSISNRQSCVEKLQKNSTNTESQTTNQHLLILPKRTVAMHNKPKSKRNRQLSLCINQNQRQSKKLNFLVLQKPKKKITKSFDYFCSSESSVLQKKKIQKLELIKRTLTHKFKANRYSFQQLQNDFLEASTSFITVSNFKQLLQQFPFFLLKNCVDFLIEYCFGKDLMPQDQIEYSILAVKLREFIEDYSAISEEQEIILNEKMRKLIITNMKQIVQYLSTNENRIGQITESKFNSILKNFHLSSKEIQFIISQSVLISPDADHILYQKFLQTIAKKKVYW